MQSIAGGGLETPWTDEDLVDTGLTASLPTLVTLLDNVEME